MSRFDGQVALVTGAGAGIGAATAALLARHGARVAVADIDGDAAAAVAANITQAGDQALPVVFDVASESAWIEASTEVAAALGPVTLFHSNAAITSADVMQRDVDLQTLDVDLWDRVLGVNLRGAMLGVKHLVGGMLAAGRGSIVFTSSITAITAAPDRAAYASSKGALISLARVVASMYGDRGVRCNAVAPGVIETAAIAVISDELKRGVVAGNMLPRLGTVDDVANAVSFLLSDDAAFITAHVLVVDGGATARFARPR